MEVVLFALAAIGALAGGVGVIASRLPVRSALSLLLVLGSLAVTYLLLAAQFIAVLQVIVYAGAIVVVFLFVIMLLRGQLGETSPTTLRWQGPVGIVLAAAFLTVVLLTIRVGARAGEAAVPADFGTAQSVGRTLFTTFLLPFELASVILLVGIVAAVVIGRPATRPPMAMPQHAKTPVEASRR
jgi:NADH-quinone oxidoreductase subunit J